MSTRALRQIEPKLTLNLMCFTEKDNLVSLDAHCDKNAYCSMLLTVWYATGTYRTGGNAKDRVQKMYVLHVQVRVPFTGYSKILCASVLYGKYRYGTSSYSMYVPVYRTSVYIVGLPYGTSTSTVRYSSSQPPELPKNTIESKKYSTILLLTMAAGRAPDNISY